MEYVRGEGPIVIVGHFKKPSRNSRIGFLRFYFDILHILCIIAENLNNAIYANLVYLQGVVHCACL